MMVDLGAPCWPWVTLPLLLLSAVLPSSQSVILDQQRPNKVIICTRSYRLECPASQVLHIVYSNYGRQNSQVCPGKEGNDVTCINEKDSLWRLRQQCSGEQRCRVRPGNDSMDDPVCEGPGDQEPSMYLELHYICINGGNVRKCPFTETKMESLPYGLILMNGKKCLLNMLQPPMQDASFMLGFSIEYNGQRAAPNSHVPVWACPPTDEHQYWHLTFTGVDGCESVDLGLTYFFQLPLEVRLDTKVSHRILIAYKLVPVHNACVDPWPSAGDSRPGPGLPLLLQYDPDGACPVQTSNSSRTWTFQALSEPGTRVSEEFYICYGEQESDTASGADYYNYEGSCTRQGLGRQRVIHREGFDPAPLTSQQYALVKGSDGARVLVCQAHDWEHLCPERTVHVFTAAYYGRRQENVCVPQDVKKGCTSMDSLLSVDLACGLHQYCHLEVDEQSFSLPDSCPAQWNYLEFTYSCIPDDSLVPMCDDDLDHLPAKGFLYSPNYPLDSSHVDQCQDKSQLIDSPTINLRIIYISPAVQAYLCGQTLTIRATGYNVVASQCRAIPRTLKPVTIPGPMNIEVQTDVPFRFLAEYFGPDLYMDDEPITEDEDEDSVSVAVPASVAVIALIAIVAVVAIFVIRRRQRHSSHTEMKSTGRPAPIGREAPHRARPGHYSGAPPGDESVYCIPTSPDYDVVEPDHLYTPIAATGLQPSAPANADDENKYLSLKNVTTPVEENDSPLYMNTGDYDNKVDYHDLVTDEHKTTMLTKGPAVNGMAPMKGATPKMTQGLTDSPLFMRKKHELASKDSNIYDDVDDISNVTDDQKLKDVT